MKCHIGAAVECSLRARIVALAKAKDMSLSAVIRQALKQYAEREES